MKLKFPHIILLVILLLATSCSTKKNTWTTRTVHSINTRYNIYFNGKTSYDEALKAIAQANKDDYSQIINMYPISNHESASAGSGQLDRTIEKCRKAIKTRSLKIKPKSKARRNRKKAKLLAEQEEFNPFMSEVWLLLAKAEFHKADFLGAIGTFNYIARHFSEKEELGVTCQLWVARSYAEMGWIYEAEDLLSKVDQKGLIGDNISLYTAVFADLLLKKGQYREAIPFLEKTIEKERDKALRLRFNFLLAQLYQHSGNKKKAQELYTSLIKKNPPYEMDFNARLSRSKLFLGDMKKLRGNLFRMAKDFNNRDYLDQVYDAIAQSYLYQKDTINALVYLQEAIDNSTRNGMEKAMSLVLMGDLYYQNKEYVKAQPNYDEASKIIPIEHAVYPRVFKRSEVLSELVVEHNMVILQDSLQRLSAMSEEERLVAIKAYIAKLEEDEKRAAERDEMLRKRQETNQELATQTAMVPIGAGINPQNEWYFYNPNLIRTGQNQFQQKWGRRKLEDHWRRTHKGAVVFNDDVINQDLDSVALVGDNLIELDDMRQMDEMVDVADINEELDNTKNPAYYLKQIPQTEEQIELSNQLWAEALFNMAVIYKDKLDENQLAINAFEKYLQRFPYYGLGPNALYELYVIYTKGENIEEAESTRQRLLNSYATDSYAKLLSDPHYFDTKRQMLIEEDSLYHVVYKNFNKNEFDKVIDQVDHFKNLYSSSSLMPKFMFLQALSYGKTKNQTVFESSLQSLLAEYPHADVSTVAKDILALILQGKEAQQGTTGTLADKRIEKQTEELIGDTIEIGFSSEENVPHRVLLVAAVEEEDLYSLQFQIAIFNFSRFLVKDFELTINQIEQTKNAISIYDFDKLEEANWYVDAINENQEIAAIMNQLKAFPLVISEHNYSLLRSGFSIADYLTFKTSIKAK